MYTYIYIYNIFMYMHIYIYIKIYKFTSEFHSQTTLSSEWG